MTKESLLGHIVEAYDEFTQRSRIPADAILRDYFRKRTYLGARDRRSIAVSYYDTVRNFLRLEAIVIDATGSDLLDPALVVAATFIVISGADPKEMRLLLSRIPNEFAAEYAPEVFEAIADRDREEKRLAALEPIERLSVEYSMPHWFVGKLVEEYGTTDATSLLQASNKEASVALRANTIVMQREEVIKWLTKAGVEAKPSAIAADGILLSKRINVMEHAEFRKGGFEIQDEASQLVAPFAGVQSNRLRILDACAGAGGKTLHFAALLGGKGEIIATDIDPYKLDEMKKRVKRSTAQNIRIVYPDDYLKHLGEDKNGSFDVVLLDVPCTGTGTLRRNPSIKWHLSNEMHDELIEKQRMIVEENLRFVKPGGVLLYSTCSLLRTEGEEQIEWIQHECPDLKLEATFRTRPDVDECDGFFVARLRRLDTQPLDGDVATNV
jgi:16S rRNA (cytosine967-C5)-methyltransferase